MPREITKDQGEKTQIAILTCAMTAGAFALVTLVFVFFLNPSAAQSVERAERSLTDLSTLLLTQEMKDLRANAKRSEGQEANKKSLAEIALEALSSYGLKYPAFPPAKSDPLKPGLDKVKQTIKVDPAKLRPILQFIASVQDAKKTIQVEAVNIQRDTRSKAEDDMWTASVDFVDYVAK